MSICYVLVQVWACPQTRVCCLNGPLFTVATPEDQEITFFQGEVCASETKVRADMTKQHPDDRKHTVPERRMAVPGVHRPQVECQRRLHHRACATANGEEQKDQPRFRTSSWDNYASARNATRHTTFSSLCLKSPQECGDYNKVNKVKVCALYVSSFCFLSLPS